MLLSPGCCCPRAPQCRVPKALGDAAGDRLGVVPQSRVLGLSRVISLSWQQTRSTSLALASCKAVVLGVSREQDLVSPP